MIISPGDLISFKHSVGTSVYPNHVCLFHAGTPVIVILAAYDIVLRYNTWRKFQTENSHMFLTPDGRPITQRPGGSPGYFSISFLWNGVPTFIYQVHHDDIQIITATN
jgi:hypothetical protein